MDEDKKNYPQLHIQLLEPRIMFDGAAIYAASEAIDLLNEQNTFSSNENSLSSDLNPVIENLNSRKEIVFIDSGVDDYQTIVNAIDSSKSIYLIDANENGFLKMQNILQDQSEIDAVHIIGHASAGQVVLGNSILNADTINAFSNTLQSIGNSLTQEGDLLFYGCNLAQGEQAKLLLQQIGNITQADIAASDDITGQGGDWELEHNHGIVETKGIEVVDYKSFLLQEGISSLSGFVENTGTNLRAGTSDAGTAASASNHTDGNKPYVITYERTVTSGSFTFYNNTSESTGFEESNSGVQTAGPTITSNTTTVNASSTPMNVYYVYATESTGRNDVRSVTFDGEIKGVWFNMNNITSYANVSKSGASYHTNNEHGSGGQNAWSTEKLKWKWDTNVTVNSKPNHRNDWFGVDTDSNTLYVGFNNNGNHGDVVRVFTEASTNAPVARNDSGVVNEDATLTVSNNANRNLSGSYNVNGEHSGDVIDTNSTSNQDTDADGDTLTVTAVRTGSTEGSGSSGSVGSALTGTYGQLTLNSNGSYSYVANQSAADALDAGDTAYDYFNYTVSDGTQTDTAVITIIVKGLNDDVVAVNDYGVVTEDATLTVTNGESRNLSGSYDTHDEHSGDISANDTDNDASPTHTITAIRTGSTEGSGTAGTLGSALTGTYGQLTLNANGSYTYVANQSAADALDVGDSVWDYFNYTVSDGTDTDTGRIYIKVLGANDTPVAQNDEGLISEGSTLTVSNGANANVSGSYDATGEHTGDVMDTSSSSHSDSDPDASASLSITGIRTGQESGSGTSGSVGSSLSGTYGALTINANGSYSYAANSSISGLGSGDEVIDYFTYTVSDGSATDTAQLKITVIGVGNTAPVARNDVGVIAEDSTLSVSDGANANETGGSYNATGEHSGDVINTSSTTHYDTDADGDTLTVTAVRTGSSEGSGTAGSVGSALTGTYGQLTLNANGSYTYVANQTAADALDAGDSVTDSFNYTISDGSATDIGTITITVLGINDAPVAQDDVGVIAEGSTLTVANSANANVSGSYDATGEHSGDVINTSSSSHTDSDADASSSLSITHVKLSGGSNSTVASSSSYNSNGTSITGTYGTLTIGADGSYTYAATTDATDALDAGESATDTFVYTLSDGTAITTANITITVLGSNDAPVAQNDTGTILEDGTLTVSDSDGTSTIAGASFVDRFSVLSQETLPVSLAFNTDGTKMFVLGMTGVDVNEYTLSTGFDVSTASFVDSFSVSSQDTAPTGLAFNTDGTKMFVVGRTGNDVNEYTLSTGYDVSTASYDSNFSVSSQTTTPHDLAFNSDGTKMFVVGDDTNRVYEYTLSTGFDVSTASYDSNFSVQFQETAPYGLAFNTNGTKMFVLGNNGDDVNEYTLSTGFDVSTASFVDSFDVSGQDSMPFGLAFNTDGTKMFVSGRYNGAVGEYTLTTPFSLVDVSGEHTGDVIDSSNTSTRDTDVDIETLTVTAVRLGSSEGSGTAGSVGSALTGTYGQLTLNSNGSYTYVANQTAADALDTGDVVTDTFNYTVSDGTATDTAVITITVIGINDAPTAQNDVGVIVEDGTLTVANSANATLTGTYDATGENSGDLIDTSSSSHTDSDSDASASLSITQIKKSGGSNSAVGIGSSYNSSGTSVTGTYGTLTIGADGSYTYVADQTAADALDAGDSANDVFVYTLSDGTATTTANITISVLGINDDPAAVDDTDSVSEDGTVTKTGAQDDVLTDDSDPDDSATLTVTAIQPSGGSSSNVSSGSTYDSSGTSVTGTYGTLIIGADGSYTYTADQSAADDLDAGDSANDVFTYTVSDGTTTTTATITITVNGINDTPVAQNDVGVIVEDGTLTVANSANATLTGTYDATGENSGDLIDTSSSSHTDSDADDSASLTITQIKKDGGSNSSVSSGSSYNSSGTSVTGTYGTLTIGADGSYTYAATQDAADVLDVGESATDVFVYTLSDGTATTTANLTITILGANDAPVAANDYGAINEDATLTVSDGDNQTVSGRYDASGEHSGDVINTSYTGTDTDVDGDTLTVSAVRLGSTEGSGTAGTVGQALTGTYGQLTLNANGSYTYVANQTAADALDVGDQVTDSFNYTVSDGALTDTALLEIKVFGVNDTPVAQNDVGVIAEDSTLTVTNGANATLTGDSYDATGENSGDVINTSSSSHQDSDADASASLTVTQIKKNGGSNSSVSSGSSYNSSGTAVTGTYGTLTIGADGSYTYAATADAADGIASGETATDVFVYTLSDGTETTTANIIITILGANDSPTAQNDVGVIMEGSTLTVANSANANVSGSYDTTGEHSGDVIDTSSSSHTDTDPDTSNTLTITQIKKDGGSNSAVSSGSSYNSSGTAVTGAYGTLTIGADGSYKYVAQSNISGFDPGETLTDTFTYTVSDGTVTTTANIVITLLGDDGNTNNAPVARDDVGVILEDGTLTVANGDNANETNDSGSTYNATGEHSGDVINTSSTTHYDTDADSDTITITQIRTSSGSDSAVSSGSSYNSSGTSVTGTYGTLTIGADGSYTYVADQAAADALDLNDSVTDTFIYTITDDASSPRTPLTDSATLTITVLGINDTPTAVNDTDSVNEDGTVTKTGAQDDVLTDDTDPDESPTLTVTAIQPSGSSSSNVSSGSTYASSGTSVTGTYGTLIIGADGSYTYTADQAAADALDASDTEDDVFTYTVTDENGATATATITITVTGINDTPVAQNDVGVITEDATLTVANGDNANETNDSGSTYNATGEHSGDVINTSSGTHQDSDADASASLTVSQIKKDGGSNSAVSSGSSYNSSGTSVTGTYGTLTIGADGSYTYVADQTAADALDAGDSADDVFVYTLSDGTASTTANITISVLGINDDPAAVDDTDSVSEDGTVTKTGSQDDVLNDDTDADDSSSLTVTAIQPSGGSSSNVSSGSTYDSSGTSVTGTYGTLIIGADGSYTYTADQSAADDLDAGDTVDDVFTYTVSDGTTTTTATITITVTGVNDTPVAQNDVGVIAEDSTLTVINGANANLSGSYDATGEHSGDVIDTSSSSHTDSDADDSASLTITHIKKSGGSNSTVSSGSSYNSSGTSVTGTYGTLTIGADGSYTYVADQTAADALDAGDSANDVFVYTLSDGTATTTANITISVLGINDDPAAVDDTDTVSEGATVTKTGSQDDVLNDDTDADDSSSLTVTAIQPSGGSSSSVTSSSTYESSGTTVTGTYGTLTIGADGSYTYTANQDAADALDDSESATDVFTYTVSDGTSTDTATITITVNGSNDAPVARNDTGTVEEDATLTVSDGDNANAVTSATYVDAFDISSQEFSPQGFTFSNDGTKMFLTGNNGDDVNEYTLSTGFDVSTASFVDSFDISSQEQGPRDLAFSADGTKMFVVGVLGDDVNEYTLSTAFDVSTSSFVDSFDISSQEDSPTGLAFNNDGTKMFIAGNGGDDINEYTLSTGFDVSTASFVDSFDVSSQDTAPNGLTFNSDGTKMYVVGNQGNDINEYDLTLGFDVSTASFVGALDVSSQDSAPKAISFNHDGTKLFVLGTTNRSIFEYTLTSPFSLINVDAEHSGDVIDTSNTSSYDTDVDVETLTVTAVRLGSSEGSGTAGTVGSALTGTYGQLTLNANGSYTYVANQSAADDLDAGDIVYDYFNYTVSDGDATDIAVITITVVGINDTPVAVNDTDSVNEDATVTKTGSQDDALYDDTDADDSDSLTVTGIAPSGGSTSTVSEGSTYASGGTTVTGTYGTLIIGADGSYTYTADQSAADDLDLNDTATDVFTYTVSDGANTTTATITITVTGINDDPVAQNDVGVIAEDSTLTVINAANANVSGTYDATGEHSGDVIDTSSSSHTDSDADDSASLTITHIKKSGGSNSTVSSGSSYNSSGTSVTGTYGTLTIGADGSYTYAATESAADDLDVGDEVTDVFTYTLSDGTETTTANITITVIGINDTPTAVNDTDSVTEDERVTKTAVQDDVLNDDTDPDDSASLVVTNISHTNGNNGTVSSSTNFANGTTVVGTYGTLTIGANGSYTYIADQDAADNIADGSSETDVFTYTVSDGNGGTDTATLTITVNGSDNEVVAVTDTGAVDASSTLSKSVTSAGLLSNDTDNGSAALSVGESSVSAIRTGTENGTGTGGTIGSTLVGTYGTLTLNSDGTYTYAATTAAADALAPLETAVDYFTYTLSDGTSTDTAELRITVTGINNAPTSTSPPTINAAENQRIIIQTRTFFNDPDPSNNTYGQLTYSSSGLPGGLRINDAGRVVGRLQEGTYTFTVTATDGGNLSTQQTFTIVVGKPGRPGEPKPPPVRVNPKTFDDAVANEVVVFREAPEQIQFEMEALEVGGSLESIVKEYSFNGGMKVIDVAVEDLNIDQSGRIGVQEDTILGFSIGDDFRLSVKQYTGTLEDGSSLPDWVKVDPSTGQTIVQFPDDVYAIDVKLIAIDKDNTTREINVTLDKGAVRNDKSLKRDLKPFVERSTTLKSEVVVDDKGQVILGASSDNVNDSNRSANLNGTNLLNSQNETSNNEQQTDSNNIDLNATLKLASVAREGNIVKVKINDDNSNNVAQYSLKVSKTDSSPRAAQNPDWLQIDPQTGEIQAQPPENVEGVSLQILAEDDDGVVRTLEIDVDFTSEELSLNMDQPEIEGNIVEFASLQDQINLEFEGYENYGDKFTNVSG